jgi:retinol-binding protein 3
MRLIKLFLLVLTAHFITSNLNAQNQLTKAVKTEVVNNLAKSLIDNYIFADKARNMKNLIQKNLATGLYDNIKNPYEFSEKLTKDLRSVCNDLHLSVRFNPGQEKSLSDASDKSAYKQTQAIEEAKKQNFGFKKVEILNDNIGYVYFDSFYDLNEMAKITVDRVFTYLKRSDALIIDLRNNGGGSPDMVKYICSFFFNKPTHINDLYERRTNKTQSYWTVPVKDSEYFSNIPVYVLISRNTFSAAEEFAYDLQVLHRAQLIGETTGGGAHPVSLQLITHGFIGFIPYARAVNPVTKTNWEAVGVKPDVKVASNNAIDTARIMALEKLKNKSRMLRFNE